MEFLRRFLPIQTQQERVALETEVRAKFSSTHMALGIVEEGSMQDVRIENNSKYPMLWFTASCGCVSDDIAIHNKGHLIKGQVKIEPSRTEQVFTDGTKYYIRNTKVTGKIAYTDIQTGQNHYMEKAQYEKLDQVTMQKLEHSLTFYFHKPTRMYVVKDNRHLAASNLKPRIHVPITAYVLPANGSV